MANARFYSAGLTYRAIGALDNLQGKISAVVVKSDKHGMAGIEQDIVIETDTGNLTLEIINWHYGKKIHKVGYVLYGPNGYIKARRIKAELRTIYNYDVLIKPDGFHIDIRDGSKKIVSEFYPCGAKRIFETSSYIEYWRYDEPGSYLFYGYVTIDNPVKLQRKEEFHYKAKGYPCDLYFFHHNWDGVVDKGEIDDR